MKSSTQNNEKRAPDVASASRENGAASSGADARPSRPPARSGSARRGARAPSRPESAYFAPLMMSALLALLVSFLAASSGP